MTSRARQRARSVRRLRPANYGFWAVLWAGILVIALLEAKRDGHVSTSAFVFTLALLSGLAVVCILLLRRAERERATVEAERRLARVAVEEQTLARLRAEQVDAVSRGLIQILGRELRGPLAGIRGFARELEERGGELSSEQQAEFFSVIRRQSHRLARAIEDLMLAARLTGGDVAEELLPVDAGALITNTVAEVEGSGAHNLEVSLGEDLPRVRADPLELRQALLALIENAIRFSPGGTTVSVAAAAAHGVVEISVRDEGVGVPDELRDRVLELLTAGREAILANLDGLGVGLFLVRSVAARCEGEVRFDSTPGKGSMFTLTLPAISADDETILLTHPIQVERISDQ
jgi:two-component system, OmpR family, sensor histidine kinase KdpD